MNNLRFAGTKMKRRYTFTMSDTAKTITVNDVVTNEDLKGVNIRFTKLEIEVSDPSVSRNLIVLNRNAEIIAQNSVGPDGFYKIPSEHFLNKGFASDDQSMSTYVLVASTEDLTKGSVYITIHYEIV